ncbi:hypothetical protein PCE1_000795 [Barthelona sp. PCE]
MSYEEHNSKFDQDHAAVHDEIEDILTGSSFSFGSAPVEMKPAVPKEITDDVNTTQMNTPIRTDTYESVERAPEVDTSNHQTILETPPRDGQAEEFANHSNTHLSPHQRTNELAEARLTDFLDHDATDLLVEIDNMHDTFIETESPKRKRPGEHVADEYVSTPRGLPVEEEVDEELADAVDQLLEEINELSIRCLLTEEEMIMRMQKTGYSNDISEENIERLLLEREYLRYRNRLVKGVTQREHMMKVWESAHGDMPFSSASHKAFDKIKKHSLALFAAITNFEKSNTEIFTVQGMRVLPLLAECLEEELPTMSREERPSKPEWRDTSVIRVDPTKDYSKLRYYDKYQDPVRWEKTLRNKRSMDDFNEDEEEESLPIITPLKILLKKHRFISSPTRKARHPKKPLVLKEPKYNVYNPYEKDDTIIRDRPLEFAWSETLRSNRARSVPKKKKKKRAAKKIFDAGYGSKDSPRNLSEATQSISPRPFERSIQRMKSKFSPNKSPSLTELKGSIPESLEKAPTESDIALIRAAVHAGDEIDVESRDDVTNATIYRIQMLRKLMEQENIEVKV